MPEPLERRLLEPWRWRALGAPAGEFVQAIGSTAGALYIADRNGVTRFDGTGWSRMAGQPSPFQRHRIAFLGDQPILNSASGLVRFIPGGTIQLTSRPTGLVADNARHDRVALATTNSMQVELLSGEHSESLPPVPGAMLTGIGFDRSDHLWAATASGLFRFEEQHWTDLTAASGYRPGLARVSFEVAGEDLFIVTGEPHKEDRVLRYDGSFHDCAYAPPSGRILAALGLPDGGLLLAVSSGSLAVARDDQLVEVMPPTLYGDTIIGLCAVGDTRLAALTASGQVWSCDLGSHRWCTFPPPRNGPWQHVNAMCRSARGGYWLATGGGIVRFTGRGFTDWIDSERLGGATALTAVLEDVAGRIWTGSGSAFEGVYRIDPDGGTTWLGPEQIGPGYVHAIRSGANAEVWLLRLGIGVTDDETRGGVTRFDRDGRCQPFDHHDGLPNARCYDLAFDLTGRPIVGTRAGIARMVQGDPPRWQTILPEIHAGALFVQRDRLWVSGGLHGTGVIALDLHGDPPVAVRSLPQLRAASFIADGDDVLVASSVGLFHIDATTVREISGEPGIPGYRFWPMLRDDDGRTLWLGSLGRGLVRYQPDDHQPPAMLELSVGGDDRTPTARWRGVDPWNTTPEDQLHYQLRLDAGEWQAIDRATAWVCHSLRPGRHTCEVRAIDLCGNVSAPMRATFAVAAPLYLRPATLLSACVALLALVGAVAHQRRRAVRSRHIEAQRQARILESEQRFRGLVEHSSAVLCHHDANGRLEYVSPNVEAFLGVTASELLARPDLWDERVHADDLPMWQALCTARIDAQAGAREAEYRIRHQDGSWRHLRTWQTPRVADGRATGVDTVSVDLTEARLVEAALQRSRNLESLGLLAGGIAHDFNNLLVSIRGNADLMRYGSMTEADKLRSLDAIENASLRAAELCHRMLTFAGRARIEIADIDIAALVEHTVALLRGSLPARPRVAVVRDEVLPQIRGDAAQIQQLLMNLVLNAAEASGPDGHVTIRLERCPPAAAPGSVVAGTPRPGRAYVTLSVADDGHGIAPDLHQRIFEPFYSTKGAGRGLGLAGVLGIIKAHDALLTLESAAGRGTRFQVYLPLPDPPPAPSAPRAPRTTARGTVLIIDDDDSVADVAARALRSLGFDAVIARSATDGLRTFARHGGLCAVLLDLTLPDRSGLDVFRDLRALHADLPIVLTSGYHQDSDHLTAAALGPHAAFLAKPWTKATLRACLEQAWA